jgi:hypothetical protein
MLRQMTGRQFYEWVAYAEMEPFGERRDDYRAASIVQMIHNSVVKKEHQKSMDKFLLPFGEETHKQTPQQQKALFFMMVGAHAPLPKGERAIDG